MIDEQKRRLLNEIAEQDIPGNVNLWPRLRTRIAGTHALVAGRLISAVTLIALMLTVVLLGLTLAASRPASVPVAGVGTVAPESPVGGGYHARLRIQRQTTQEMPVSVRDITWELSEAEVWYAAPGLLRTEQYNTCSSTVGLDPRAMRDKLTQGLTVTGARTEQAALWRNLCEFPSSTRIGLADGRGTYVKATRDSTYRLAVFFFEEATDPEALPSGMPIPLQQYDLMPGTALRDLETAISRYSQHPALSHLRPITTRILGRELVAGRSATIIQFERGDDASRTPASFLWLDDATFLPLAGDGLFVTEVKHKSEYGEIIRAAYPTYYSWQFTLFEPAVIDEADVFAFVPGANSRSVYYDQAAAWQEAGQQIGMNPFFPADETYNALAMAGAIAPQPPQIRRDANHNQYLFQEFLQRGRPGHTTPLIEIWQGRRDVIEPLLRADMESHINLRVNEIRVLGLNMTDVSGNGVRWATGLKGEMLVVIKGSGDFPEYAFIQLAGSLLSSPADQAAPAGTAPTAVPTVPPLICNALGTPSSARSYVIPSGSIALAVRVSTPPAIKDLTCGDRVKATITFTPVDADEAFQQVVPPNAGTPGTRSLSVTLNATFVAAGSLSATSEPGSSVSVVTLAAALEDAVVLSWADDRQLDIAIETVE